MSSKPSLLDEACSLMQHDTPNFERTVHRAKVSCSSLKDNGNKENMGMNQEEVPMLSLEPISMKRKKKGGGYNLRKSLAWDRAFLTEEGILDPMELSVISGTCGNNGGQALSVISEVGSYFKHADSQNMISSPSSLSHQRKKASQKMSTIHCPSGSGAKSSGCPRPSPTSSLKRPAFVNTSRSSSKELKFTKTAIPKPSMCSIPRSAKSSLSVGSQLQHNQSVQSVANKQTCIGSSKISPIKNTPQVKTHSAVSPSTSSSKLLKGNSIQTTTSLPSTKIHQPPGKKVYNTCLKKTPREVDALCISQTKEDGSVDIAPVPQRTTDGKGMHQFQAKKPSGLRMPSPSLGFFSQPKVSTPNQPTLLGIKPNISSVRNFRDPRKGKILHRSTMPLSSTSEKIAFSDSDCVASETSESVLEQNTNKFVHADISGDELPMHGADAIDKLDKVHSQHETGIPIIFKGDSERETSESVLEQNMNKSEHTDISYDKLAMHEADSVDKSDKVHAQHETNERITFKSVSVHKINDIKLLPQPGDDDMEKSIQRFQDFRSNDRDSTCSPSICQKSSAISGQHEGDVICNSVVTSRSFTCEFPLEVEDIVRDKKSTENHHELPLESCYQSLDQSDAANFSAPEVSDSNKNDSTSEVPEDSTFKDVYVLEISGEVKCQAPESCDSELESSYFLPSGKYENRSTDSGKRTKVDDETYLGEGQSHSVNGVQLTNFPKNYLNVKAVTSDLMEYSEKHWEAERIHIAIEESSHCNPDLVVTGDLLPERELIQENVVEVPSSTVPKESDEGCENTSFVKNLSRQGAMARENSPSSQHKFDGPKNDLLEDEDNAEILFKVEISDGEELTHNYGSISIEKIKNSDKDLNKIDGQLILPKDLVPFSDEWLAAIEAAGEDVLTLKTGAVQNSPPDKSLPELGPWSPVKRKSNQLGPFDCTKYTNQVPSDSPQ